MRQIAADRRYYFHHTLDERVVYQQVGFVWQWRILLHAWDRLQRYQMIDNDEGFCAVADVIRGARRERFYVEDVVTASGDGVAETALFVHPASLADLVAGCQELRDMMDSDAAGNFRGYQASPLLEPDEEYLSRQLIQHVLTVDQNRIVPFRRRFRETA